MPAVTVFVVAAVFYGGHRIRSTLEPAVVVCAAVAIVAGRGNLMRGGWSGPAPDAPHESAK